MAQPKSVRLVTEAALDVSTAGVKADVAADLAPIRNDVDDLKVIGGISPGSVNDTTSANLIETPGTATHTALSATIDEAVYDVPPHVANLPNANDAFIAAAVKARAAGRDILRVAPGTYNTPLLHPDDILDCYVVGEGVNLAGAWLYPFTATDWASNGAVSGNGGRGRIAIEFDDGSPQHWTDIFPLSKKYNFPIGTAWHTGNGERWIKEAHRHGWEIISHLPDNTQATSVSLAALEVMAKESKDAIQAITGQDEVGFVYPQHARSAETDRVLSKYYSYGRGQSFLRQYRADKTYQEWLTSSFFIDPHITTGSINGTIKSALKSIAATNTGAVLYFHHVVGQTTTLTAIPELVKYARDLGIEIVRPSQIVGNRDLIPDPYELTGDKYAITGNLARSTVQAYHGPNSFAYVPGPTPVSSSLSWPDNLSVAGKPGFFAAYRASIRVKATAPIPIAATLNGGIRMATRIHSHGWDGAIVQQALAASAPAFRDGNTIPVSDWARHSAMILLDPSIDYIVAGVNVTDVQANAPTFWIDELKFELFDYLPEIRYTATLVPSPGDNASLVTVVSNIPNVGAQRIELVAGAGVAGKLTVSSTPVNTIAIRSDNVNDTGTVTVIVRPRLTAYPSLTFPNTGA